MADGPLTPERILDASEDVSKAALRDAVAERWLAAVSDPLAEIANEDGAAAERLRRWLDLLVSSKQDRARDDPELFATYVEIAGQSREVITEHVDGLVAQLARIIANGIAQGVFVAADAHAAGRAVFDATARFHNPANSASWADPRIAADYEQVISLILAGLSARA